LIPELAVMLGATDVPDKWKKAVFDRLWVVTFDDKGRPSRWSSGSRR
jgi:hypothetical protein